MSSRVHLRTKRSVCIADRFEPRNNALNLLRLFFSLLVIFSHSLILGGYRDEGLWGQTSLGEIAVNGFFALSGFLITASACRNNVIRYLWQRLLRIFPAFWICLLLTATIAGPIGWMASGNSIREYWSAQNGPLHYLAVNSLLKMRAYEIAGTPTGIPYPRAWDGSLWTLWYEFVCYLIIAGLAVTAILQRRRVMLALWIISWIAAFFVFVGGLHIPSLQLVRFIPIFLAGGTLWLYREKVPDSGILFSASLLTFAASTFWNLSYALCGPLLAYICVWASIHLPGKRIGSKYDMSYGVYIYAFVVAQLLAIWHVHIWGYFLYTLLTIAFTLVLAFLSCILVEQPALRLKHWSPIRYSIPGSPVVKKQNDSGD